MRKQKLAIDRNDVVDKSEKIRKVETASYCSEEVLSEIQRGVTIQSQDHSVCLSRRITSVSVIEETRDGHSSPVIRSDNFISKDYRSRETEMREQIGKNKLIIKKLEKKYAQALEKNKNLTKDFEARIQMDNEVIEKQKVSWNLFATIQEQTNVLKDELKLRNDNMEESKKKYEILELNEDKRRLLNEQLKDWDDENKRGEEILKSKSNQLLIVENECEKYKNENIEKCKLLYEIIDKRDRFDKLIKEEDENYIGKITKEKTRMRIAEDNLKTERDKKFKLITENNEISRKINDSLSEIQSLQLVSVGHEKRVEDMKLIVKTAKERVTNLDKDIDELKSRNLETISKKDSELFVLGNQLKILESEEKQTANELTEAISNNKALLKVEKEAVDDIEQLKNNLKEKDGKLMKIKSELAETVEKNKKLSIEIEILNEKSVVKDNETSKIVKDLETLGASEEEEIKEEAELSTELVTIEAKIKNKSENISELLAAKRNEEIVRSKTMKDFEIEIEKKTKDIKEREGNIKELERESEHDESRFSSELQQATFLSTQCQTVGHRKTIELQRVKIDILKRDLSALKLLPEQLDERADDATKEEEKFEKLKSQFKELNDKFSATRKQNEELENKLKNFKASFDEKKDNEIVDLTSPTRRTYTPKRSAPVTPSPKPILKSYSAISGPPRFQEVRFDLTSTPRSEEKNITASERIEEAEKRYRNSVASNRPNRLSLQAATIPLETKESSLTKISKQTVTRKFFKRNNPEIKNISRFDEDSNDPYSLKGLRVVPQ